MKMMSRIAVAEVPAVGDVSSDVNSFPLMITEVVCNQ